jgi:hypothetical protein
MSALPRLPRKEKPTSTGDAFVAISISVAWETRGSGKIFARRYVETTDKLRQLCAQFRLLDIAKEVATEWVDKL